MERGSGAAFKKSLECFTQAVALEATYAQAHAGVAQVQAMRAVLSFAAPHTVMPEAKEAVLKTLAIDETVADAYTALAVVLHWYEWDWPAAEREYRRALELNPGDAYARSMYAMLLGTVGRVDESVAEARAAVKRDPLSRFCQYVLSFVFYMGWRFDAAIAAAQAGIELDPSHYPFYLVLGLGWMGSAKYDEAIEAFRHAATIAPGDPTPQAFLGRAQGLAGQKQEALTILGHLERRRNESYVGGSLLAQVCLGLGDHDQAISWLEEAAEERDGQMTLVDTPTFDPLRSDPRFQALLQRMNFPTE